MAKRYIQVKLNEFDELLKAENGWKRNVSGKEYVYDYQMKSFPQLIIKVLSSIKEGDDVSRPTGQDAIRVFVIRQVGKKITGYAKQIRVYRTMNWRDNVKKAFMTQREEIFRREKRR